jgi:ribonucleoside-triphosphate reductase (formate)
MDIALKLDRDFIAEIEYLKVKYPEELEKMNGFHETNLDLTSFIDNFVDQNVVADTTIDANSNSSMKNIAALTKEIHKPYTKLLSYNKMYYEAKKKYGIDFADRWLDMEYSGALYMNDSHSASFQPYCYNYDLKDIAEKGLFFISGLNNKPPKHWDSFNNHIMEFIVYASGSQSGAE